MTKFIDEQLDPKEADILIFAGDCSHYPFQNKLMLEMISKRKLYKKIFVTFGNHDLYIINQKQNKLYNTSLDKIQHFKQICEDIDDVVFLDGDIIEVNGIKIAGSGLFYDFVYGLNNFNLTVDDMFNVWKESSNDSIRIKHTDKLGYIEITGMSGFEYKIIPCTFNPLNFFKKEKEKLEKIVSECDIFVSHIGPIIPPNLDPLIFHDPTTGFYFFDGESYLWREKAPKLWIFGHLHESLNFKVNNTTLMCNPLGYKDENMGNEIIVVDLFKLY